MAKQPLDHLRKKKPITTTIVIPLEDGLTEPVDEARNELGRALLLSDADREATARERLKTAEDFLRDNSIVMKFQAIGRIAFEDLLREHPPTEAQKAEDASTVWNRDTFPAAIISATLLEPALTEAEVKDEILDSENWGAAEQRMLLDAAVEVNTRRRVTELGN